MKGIPRAAPIDAFVGAAHGDPREPVTSASFAGFLTALCLVLLQLNAFAIELTGSLGIESRQFMRSSALALQERNTLSGFAQPEVYHDWDGGEQSVLFTPYLRVDSADGKRSHFDVRELIYQRVADQWEARIGVGKVFWGVTESRHLVDVINQTDLVENIDGEDKLGQPLVNVSFLRAWGTVDLFILPGFRERTFPGPRGRLRTSPYVDADAARFESGAWRKHIDYAARWSHSLGDWDVGVGHFYGTRRDPRLLLARNRIGEPVLVPRYDLIHQTSLDLQATKDAWLWKLEAIQQSGSGDGHIAWVAGFEYTLTGVANSRVDVGLLFEHLFDGRGANAPQPFENDAFAGLRLALNDEQSTEILGGVIQDLDTDSRAFSVEASRRLGERYRLEIELRAFSGVASADPLRPFARDDFVQVTLSRFF